MGFWHVRMKKIVIFTLKINFRSFTSASIVSIVYFPVFLIGNLSHLFLKSFGVKWFKFTSSSLPIPAAAFWSFAKNLIFSSDPDYLDSALSSKLVKGKLNKTRFFGIWGIQILPASKGSIFIQSPSKYSCAFNETHEFK